MMHLFSLSMLSFIPLLQFLSLHPITNSFTIPRSFARHATTPSTTQPQPLFSSTETNYDEYTALLPGNNVEIKIGDPSLSRKAWKKRRRSNSPILIPCSILGINPECAIRWNVMYILHKYGTVSELEDGVVLNMKRMIELYERELGGNLLDQAKSLEHEQIGSLLLNLFSDTYSNHMEKPHVKIVKQPKHLVLHSSFPKRRAREYASLAALIQTSSGLQQHTGLIKYRNPDFPKGEFSLEPLSAALRISQGEEGLLLQEGKSMHAFVFSYDSKGDSGCPLITFTLNNLEQRKKKKKYPKKTNRRREEDVMMLGELKYKLDDLNIGDGPFEAKIVRLSSRAQAAFVDLGVGRKRGKKLGGGVSRVLGMLRFEDLMESAFQEEEDEVNKKEDGLIEKNPMLKDEDIDKFFEEELDVTDLFDLDVEGSVFGVDPVTGEKTLLGSVDDELEQTEEEDEDDNLFQGMTPEERLHAIGQMLDDEKSSSSQQIHDETISEEETSKKQELTSSQFKQEESYKPPIILQTGDTVQVYIQRIFPQSGRFMVTIHQPEHKKPREIKQEKDSHKRLSKLEHDGILDKIMEKKGMECKGVVKAKSKTGDWYYVQPEVEGFPVGVAMVNEEEGLEGGIEKGDNVLVMLDGIDEGRGQLAMTVLGKVAP